jgi:MFS family permease
VKDNVPEIGEKTPAGIVDETVAELLSAVRDLVKEENDRANSLNGRASALTGFVGVILSIAAAGGAAVGGSATKTLDHWASLVVGALVFLALLLLVAAVVAVVWKVLLPTPGFTIKTAEVKGWPAPPFIGESLVMTQGYLLRGYVKTLERDRKRHASKATWLGRSYKLVCAGIIVVALAGMTASLDRYVIRGSGTHQQPGGRHQGPAQRHALGSAESFHGAGDGTDWGAGSPF